MTTVTNCPLDARAYTSHPVSLHLRDDFPGTALGSCRESGQDLCGGRTARPIEKHGVLRLGLRERVGELDFHTRDIFVHDTGWAGLDRLWKELRRPVSLAVRLEVRGETQQLGLGPGPPKKGDSDGQSKNLGRRDRDAGITRYRRE